MSKKRQKIKRWIDCEPFMVRPLFLANYSAEEYRKEVEKLAYLEDWELEDLEFANGSQGTFSPTKHKEVAILRTVWLKNFDRKSSYDMGTLAHEVHHLVNGICRHKGIPFDGEQNNDETFAYLTGFFIREFLNSSKK